MKALLFSAVVAAVVTPVADKPPVIKEWPVPWGDTRPRDPFLDPTTNRIWFCGQAGNYIAYFLPTTGEFKKYDLPAGSGPHNLIVDKSGMVWFSGNLAGYIGRLDPKDGSVKQYPMPDPMVRDPHTLVFDKSGDIWFTAQGGNAVGKLTVATGRVRSSRLRTARVVDSSSSGVSDKVGMRKASGVDSAPTRGPAR